MVGLFSLLVYFVIGIAVAAVERRGNESRELIPIATARALGVLCPIRRALTRSRIRTTPRTAVPAARS